MRKKNRGNRIGETTKNIIPGKSFKPYRLSPKHQFKQRYMTHRSTGRQRTKMELNFVRRTLGTCLVYSFLPATCELPRDSIREQWVKRNMSFNRGTIDMDWPWNYTYSTVHGINKSPGEKRDQKFRRMQRTWIGLNFFKHAKLIAARFSQPQKDKAFAVSHNSVKTVKSCALSGAITENTTKARTVHTSLNISFIDPANINILIPFDSVISSFRQRLVNLNKYKKYHVAESKGTWGTEKNYWHAWVTRAWEGRHCVTQIHFTRFMFPCIICIRCMSISFELF